MHYLKYISLVTTLSFYVLVGQNSKDEIWSNENFYNKSCQVCFSDKKIPAG